jgi:hypothetical protein
MVQGNSRFQTAGIPDHARRQLDSGINSPVKLIVREDLGDDGVGAFLFVRRHI